MLRRRLGAAIPALLLLLTAACGQKPGVAEQPPPFALSGAPFAIDPETGGIIQPDGTIIDPETGEVIGTIDDPDALASQEEAGGGSGGGGAGSAGDRSGGGGGGGGGGRGAPSGGNSTGITGNTIKIGVHAPITGAAPVPAQSFERGKSLYFDWLRRNGKSLSGRNVVVVSRNDNYNPSQAVAVCKELVEQEKVFLLVGAAGTDQIQACARYAASVGVPYLSGGVTEIGLTNLRNYFALWMSYKQQGPLLADLMTKRLGARGNRNGMVRFNTPTFQDARDAFGSGMRSRNTRLHYDRAVSKNASAGDAQTIATEMNQQGIRNVYPLTSPTWFIQLAQAAANQGYRPQWAGVGLTMALDTVANVACRNNNSIHGARFLNPFPAFVDSNKFDPAFRRAGGSDDIEWGLWGTSKVVWKLLSLPGKDLTRERFVHFVERAGTIKTGVLPDIRYSPSNHMGGTAMHLLRADCNQGRWVTERAFAKGF